MSVGAQPETVGPPAAGATSGGQAGAPDAAGRLLGRLSVLPALLVMSWLLAGFPLLLIGHFTPVLTLVLSIPLAVVLVPLGLRWIPGPSPEPWPARNPGKERTPWWAVAAVVAVAIAFGIDQVIYHSQFIVVMRDPASYFQFAEWISRQGSLPIPQDRAAFGGAHVLRMVMYFNPLKVLMPVALFLLGLGILKGVYDMVVHPLLFAVNTVLIFVTGLLIASLALLADLIVRSRGDI